MSSPKSEIDRARELHRGGAIDDAKRIYDSILEAEPTNADALHLLGVAGLQTGNTDQAIDLIGRAIEIDETDAHFHNNLGEAYRTRRDFQKALASYRAARVLDPGFAQAINNEGAALMALGQVSEAAQCFRESISADESYLQAYLNLGTALQAAGDATGALAALAAARALAPTDLTLLQSYAIVAARVPVEALDAACEPHIVAAISNSGVNAQRLVRPALRLLAASPALSALADAPHAAIQSGEHDRALENPILLALLERTIVANTTAEQLLTRLRLVCLYDISGAEGGLAGRLPTFASALAAQCFLTNYAYADTIGENDRLNDLVRKVRHAVNDGGSDSPDLVAPLCVIAMYRPLGEIFPASVDLSARIAPYLFELQVAAFAKETALDAAIPSLAQSINGDAEPGQQRHGEAPYPRWVSNDRRIPVPLANVLGALFPQHAMPAFASQPVRTLVAGCGTGKYAIDVAQQYLASELIAIDKRRASLRYAARMASQIGIANIAFAQADILVLHDWPERFQVVESADALRQLDDPGRGLEVLAGKLDPGGFMKIVLYSRLGRRAVTDARAMIASGPSLAQVARLREARQAIIELPRDDPRRSVTDYPEFYSLSGCRDLLYAAPERTFSIPEIASMLSTADLEFLGFQFSDPAVPTRYAQTYPANAQNDLDQWHKFEQSNPDTFAGMYQLWCQKPL